MPSCPTTPAKDFLPVIFITTSPNILIVHPSVPANTPQELVAYIKANPGKLSYGSPGLGSSGHLAGEQFKQLNALDIQHVHYRGAAPALQDLVAGHVHVMFDIVPLTKEQLAAGRVRALAITAAKREPAVPDVPTFAELGMPGIEGGPWFGLFAPAGTPRAAIDWVNAEANKAFSSPDLKARLEGQGLTLPLGTPEAFGAHVTAETARWGEVIRKGNMPKRAALAPDVNGRLVGMGLTVPLGSPEDFGRHVEAETKRWGEVIRKGNIKIGSSERRSIKTQSAGHGCPAEAFCRVRALRLRHHVAALLAGAASSLSKNF